ncbi:MAG: hypothetical protein OEU80_06275 [Deltaproteobacteria bacterium]|nr:hypothetical protein [Deltaproteobacteria bacterium]MDH3951286.1 hypothetical protein [Deltaproteobacteria bacterium]
MRVSIGGNQGEKEVDSMEGWKRKPPSTNRHRPMGVPTKRN